MALQGQKAQTLLDRKAHRSSRRGLDESLLSDHSVRCRRLHARHEHLQGFKRPWCRCLPICPLSKKNGLWGRCIFWLRSWISANSAPWRLRCLGLKFCLSKTLWSHLEAFRQINSRQRLETMNGKEQAGRDVENSQSTIVTLISTQWPIRCLGRLQISPRVRSLSDALVVCR